MNRMLRVLEQTWEHTPEDLQDIEEHFQEIAYEYYWMGVEDAQQNPRLEPTYYAKKSDYDGHD